MAKTPAWQWSEGKNPKGGLNAKGHASLNPNLVDNAAAARKTK